MMEEFGSETDSDYTSYWKDWVSVKVISAIFIYGRFLLLRLLWVVGCVLRK